MSLSSWFALWHPRYRPALAGLMAAAAVASALIYVENELLDLLTRALAATGGAEASEPLAGLAGRVQVGLPLLVLALFALSRLASGGVEFWKTRLNGRLTIQTKDDLETEILLHLLRKEDAFFSRHSPAEMVNRLAVDLQRVSERRPGLMRAWWSALVLAGNLAFFAAKDWRLAVAAVVACGAGVLWTIRTTEPAAGLDSSYLSQDEGVKSRFEDLLRAAPEVQVGNLHEKIRGYFTELLGDRSSTFLQFIRLNGMLRVGNTLSYLAAFAAMLIVVLYLRSQGAADAALALVPVIVLRLPSLFSEASELVFLRLDFQLARVSMGRLLEYETHVPARDAQPAASAQPCAAEAIRLEQATYRYAGPAGTPQGGVSDVTAALLPGRWTAIVGGAGSGKSTLLKMLLGRVKPQAGALHYGAGPLDALGDQGRAARLSLMPQAPVLLNASIRENLLFGREEPAEISEADLDLIEQAGLGRICRLKALEMLPAGDVAEIAPRILEARRELRRQLRDKAQVEVRPFEAGHADPQHWVLECLLAGRCDRARAVGLLTAEKARRRLRRLAQSEAGGRLAALGRTLLRENRHLLGIPNYHVYAQLAPFPLDESLWELRTGCAALADTPSPSPKEQVSLCLVCLMAAPAELPSGARAEALLQTGSREPLDLTWRENLLFGAVDSGSSRSGRLVDQAVLDFVEQTALQPFFTRRGLEFPIGRLGSNLSGGQGQLVALCRTLLRRTPVLVLDEPTSALDPASRARVAALLRAWRTGRVVISVSHDVEFIREADEVMLLDAGRLVATGRFDELERTSALFARTLRQA
jgi:ABC-type multidrug transport system fused ATPase/permease subunit